MVMTQSRNTPPNGKAMLGHVVTVVFKQAKDGPLVKAHDQGGIHEIMNVLNLSQLTRDTLTYWKDSGIEKPLCIGHKGMLSTIMIFASFC